MPQEKDRFFRFEKWQSIVSPLFVAYADTACILLQGGDTDERLQKHTSCAVGYIILPCKDLQYRAEYDYDLDFPHCVNNYRRFVGPDCITQFLQSLESDGRAIYQWSEDTHNINLSIVFPANYSDLKAKTSSCHLCAINFNNDSETCADHKHLTGEFRFIICTKCNKKLSIRRDQLHIAKHN